MHYCIIVAGEPEEQLAPFQENNMGTCPKEFLAFVDHTEEVTEAYNSKQPAPEGAGF